MRVGRTYVYLSPADGVFQPLVPTSRRLPPWQLSPRYPRLVHSRHTINFRGLREIPSFRLFSPTRKDKARWAAHCE